MTSARPMDTDLGRDVLARYICNGLDEAKASVQPWRGVGPRTRQHEYTVFRRGEHCSATMTTRAPYLRSE